MVSMRCSIQRVGIRLLGDPMAACYCPLESVIALNVRVSCLFIRLLDV